MDRSKGKSRLACDIAAKIEAALDSYSDAMLPSRAQLARQFQVSQATISAAAALLREKGLIELYAGKRIRRAGLQSTQSLSGPRRSSAAQLFDNLKAQISGGTLPVGHYLPKLGYYVVEKRVTGRTVRAAYMQLVAEHLAHKNGRRWIAGPGPRWSCPTEKIRPPFLLILQKKGTSWSGLYAPRTEAFSRAFSSEAARCGVQLVSAYTTVEGAPTRLHLAGRDRIIRYIRSEKERYAGALLVDKAEEIPDMVSWVDLLCATGKPVVWFDPLDQPIAFHRGPPSFTRCHFAEANGVATALDQLATAGHQVVAYVNVAGAQWRIARGDLIRECAARRIPPVRVIATSPEQFLWAGEEIRTIVDCIARLRTEHGLSKSGVFESLLAEMPDCRSLLPLSERSLLPNGSLAKVVACIRAAVPGGYKLPYRIRNYIGALYFYSTVKEMLREGVSAIIAPCDRDARSFHTWLSMTDIAVPRRLSLLSFDNYQSLHPLLPVSTVDFGFGPLGYAAFHFILGDIPVRRDRDGDIAARPFVVNRGSVDVPFGSR